MRKTVLLSLLLTTVSLSAMAASSASDLKSRLAAARQEAMQEVPAAISDSAPVVAPATMSKTSPDTAPTVQRQMLAEIHTGDTLPDTGGIAPPPGNALQTETMALPSRGNPLPVPQNIPTTLADELSDTPDIKAKPVVTAPSAPKLPPVASAPSPIAQAPVAPQVKTSAAANIEDKYLRKAPAPGAVSSKAPATQAMAQPYVDKNIEDKYLAIPQTAPAVRPVVSTPPARETRELAAQPPKPQPAPKVAVMKPPRAVPGPAVKPPSGRIYAPVPAPMPSPLPNLPKMHESVATQSLKKHFDGFVPPAAVAQGPWTGRMLNEESKNPEDVFCMIENRFDNNTALMIAQRADGYSTLGLNYGIDMLRPNQPYQITVQVDSVFEESFLGYAESSQTLVVQMGKKASFFESLRNAQAIHIEMPGTASTFAAQGLAPAMDEFGSCLHKIGGGLFPVETVVVPPVPVTPVMVPAVDNTMPAPQTMPVTSPRTQIMSEEMDAPANARTASTTNLAPPASAPAPALQPMTRIASSGPTANAADVLPPPPVPTGGSYANAPIDPVHPALPSETLGQATPSAPTTSPLPITQPDLIAALPVTPRAQDGWSGNTRQTLQQAGIHPAALQENGAMIEWTDASGLLHGQAWHVQGNDLLDAATAELDRAEKECDMNGFSSQIGLPEEMGNLSTLEMESKCDNQADASVSAWVLTQKNGQITAWRIDAPRDQRDNAFATREQLLHTVRNQSLQTTMSQ